MALSVRSAKCASRMIMFFGFLFTSLASTFAAMHAFRLHHIYKDHQVELKVLVWKYWLFCYPVLIGLLSLVTGEIGLRAYGPECLDLNKCKVVVFFIFSLILIGTESFAFYDTFSDYLQEALKNRNIPLYCDSSLWWANCHLNLAVNICLLILAGLIMLLSFWCVICCCGSFCCSNQVWPESREIYLANRIELQKFPWNVP